jgi:NADH:ubiquinone oxidoreductase subunit
MGLFSQLFTWWNGATFGTHLFTARKGERVGEDVFGNVYYKERNGQRRWVIYKGYAEASSVPAAWHGWLHHTVDTIPSDKDEEFAWQKPHLPNLTGSHMAHRPKGSILGNDSPEPTTGDYDAWQPK